MRIVNTYLFLIFLLYLNPDLKGNAIVQKENADTLQITEKVYLHVDRGKYISGEDIWFKAYVIDPSTNSFSRNTNNLHVELIASGSEIVQSRIIRIDNGTGNGDLSIPDSVPSGKYRIRAYTNHMRNYGDEGFFVKEITVVNPDDNPDNQQLPVRKIENKIDITFFPEGGSLVENVTSKICFKAVDVHGKGCDVTVKLFSSSGELITVFNSTHLGMGSFNLKPLPGCAYYAIVQGKDGTEMKAPLPASFTKGLALRTLITPDKNLILTINTNEATFSPMSCKDFDVKISMRNLVNKTTKVRIDSLANNFLIPLAGIPDGVLKVTLAIPDGLPLCERLVFLQRNENERLIITTDKKEYKPREKVTARISLSCDSTISDTGEFSMAVAEEKLSANPIPDSRSIASWFLLESDVKGPVEEPGYYFDPDNKKRLRDLDLLLMTQGWRDFSWKYDTLAPYKHEVGFTLTGHVKRILNNNPVPGAKINAAFFHQNTTEFIDTKTDKDGNFRFEELDVYGKIRAFLSSTGKLENMQGKITVGSVRYNPPIAELMQSDTAIIEINKTELASYRQEAAFKLNTLKKYKLSDTIDIGEVTITAEKIETPNEMKVKEMRRYYSTPDKELIIPESAENSAGDIFTYMSGRIAGVRIVRGIDPDNPYFPDDVKIFIRGQFSVDSESKKFSTTSGGSPESIFSVRKLKDKKGALILLDGMEVDDLSLPGLLMLPMSAVDRIDVLTASPAYGMRGANGVINIITKVRLNRGLIKPDPNTVYTSFQGFDVPRIFYSPKHNNTTEQSGTPDYRSTIFWEPVVEINNKYVLKEFYNADNKSTIKITVEGVTAAGVPLASKILYKVE